MGLKPHANPEKLVRLDIGLGPAGFGPEAFGHVFFGGVAEDGDNDGFAAGGVLAFGDFKSRGYVACGRDADEDAGAAGETEAHAVGALGFEVDVFHRRGWGRRWAGRWRWPCASGLLTR